MFIDRSSYVQFVGQDIAAVIKEGGWNNYLSYRVKSGSKYADVKLFKSLGSDGQIRNFGMVYGYDTAYKQFNDDRVIFFDSPIGQIAVGDGDQKIFNFKIYPVSNTDPIYIYIDSKVITASNYAIDYIRGQITFNVAPAAGKIISATYKLSSDAPEPPVRLNFFTFNSVYLERIASDTGAAINIGDGNGTNKVFTTPTFPIRFGSLKVYVDGILADISTYAVNYTTGKITFITAPLTGKEISVEYLEVPPGIITTSTIGIGNGTKTIYNFPSKPIGTSPDPIISVQGAVLAKDDYLIDFDKGEIVFDVAPDIGKAIVAKYLSLSTTDPSSTDDTVSDSTFEAKSAFDPNITDQLMRTVYESLNYLYPSPPTVISFTTSDYFGRAWQRDSLIYYWGNVNKDRIILFFRPDPTGGPTEALFSPLYLGRLLVRGKSPRRNMILIGGCRDKDESKWAANKKLGPVFMDYGVQTSNGNNSVLLSQSIGGSYYQKHYLAFITHDRNVDDKEGRYNPSLYSGKYHFSRIWVIHPNDGYVGELDDLYAIHPRNIFQLDQLEIDETITGEEIGIGDGLRKAFTLTKMPKPGTVVVNINCNQIDMSNYTIDMPNKTIIFNTAPKVNEVITATYQFHHVYKYTLPTSPISPYTLEGVTPFNPIGLAVFVENKVTE